MASDAPPEDDDVWLYGDNPEEQRKEELNAIFDRATEEVIVPSEENTIATNGDVKDEPVETETNENKEVKPANENEEEKDSDDDEDSDDDDDTIQVTIGAIEQDRTGPYPYGGAPVNLNIKRGGFTAANAAGTGTKTKGIDLDTVGLINGVSLYEFNLDTIEDKPWRKPGADITDYFNYGFSEDTWKIYCEKQRKLRMDNNAVPKVVQIIPGKDQQIPIATVNENSKYSGIGVGAKKAGPPPGRRMSGSIDVICGANSSRRSGNAKENVIQVIGRDVYDSSLPPGLPPTHIPPPFIPPNLSVPPPGLPPGMPPTIPPPPGTLPGHVPFPDLYGNPIFSQPPPLVPGVNVDSSNSQYDEQFFTGNSSRPFDANSESQHSWTNSPHRERGRDRDRDRDRTRDRSRDKDRYWEERGRERSSSRIPGTEDEYKRREEYERRRYREYRERRDKDRYERDYDRDYDREHYERDRDSRERDRERRHRDRDKDREERHKERSRRRHHHDEDDEHHSSRHKHKKSKREKEEPAEGVMEETQSTQPETTTEGGEEEK